MRVLVKVHSIIRSAYPWLRLASFAAPAADHLHGGQTLQPGHASQSATCIHNTAALFLYIPKSPVRRFVSLYRAGSSNPPPPPIDTPYTPENAPGLRIDAKNKKRRCVFSRAPAQRGTDAVSIHCLQVVFFKGVRVAKQQRTPSPSISPNCRPKHHIPTFPIAEQPRTPSLSTFLT